MTSKSEENSNAKQRINRKFTVAIVLLVLIPTIMSGMVLAFHGKISVGIVLEEGVDPRFAEDASDGLLIHGDYFEPRILDERFNSSEVRTRGAFYLSKDFNDPEFSREVRQKHGVHVILVITDRRLRNWIDNPGVAWGEADTRSASAVMTVHAFEVKNRVNKIHIMHTAIHEVSHLLGYLHEKADMNCVMQYAENGLNYSFKHGFELPYRAAATPLALEKDTWASLFIIKAVITLIFIQYVMAVLLLFRMVFSRFGKAFSPIMINLGRDISISFFILMVAQNVLSGILASVSVAILVSLLIHLSSSLFKREKANGDVIPPSSG
jgi:hypothetical protein